jgi:hypothetical protein
MGILRSRRIRTTPPEVEATKKINKIANGTTIKVTTAVWSVIRGSRPRRARKPRNRKQPLNQARWIKCWRIEDEDGRHGKGRETQGGGHKQTLCGNGNAIHQTSGGVPIS